MTKDRLKSAAERATRLRRLPGAGTVAETLSASLVTPAAFYGTTIQGISPSSLDQMRVQAAALSRAGHAGYRCA